MSVTSQQVTKSATTKPAHGAVGMTASVRGFAGNHTMMKKQSPSAKSEREADEAHRPLSEGNQDLLQRKCACGTSGMGGECEECKKPDAGMLQRAVQTKLAVNEAGDRYEQEADRIADQVMATSAHSLVSGTPPRIQRLVGQPTGRMDAAPASVDQALASPGRPLEPALRQDMEQRFGHDFSRVRVHSDEEAEQSVRDVSAHAYTVGPNVVFGPGRFAPGTQEGRRLLAHELTHVIQQSAAATYGSLEIADSNSAAERLAETTAARMLRGGEGFGTQLASTRVEIARQDDGTSAQSALRPASPSRVDLVRVSCESNTIEFETDAGVKIYELIECAIEDADYIATVTVEGNNVDFSPPPDAPEAYARFPYRIAPDQPNPSTFFPDQTTVHIVTGTLSPQPSPGPRVRREPLVCSRPLDFPRWTGLRNFRHAFINDPPANYAIRDLIKGNGVTTSCTRKTDASRAPDDPAAAETICKPCQPGSGQTVADVSRCLRAVFSAYAEPNLYRNLPDPDDGWKHGPNSNSFAAAMAKCCVNFSPSGLGRLPGWDHRPAGPCLSTTNMEKQDNAAPERELKGDGGRSGGGGATGTWPPLPASTVTPPGPFATSTEEADTSVQPSLRPTGPETKGPVGKPDVYRSGNVSSPRIDHVRVPKDIKPDNDDYVYPKTGGVSSFSTVHTGKPWWKFPTARSAPEGIEIRNDHNDHYAWEPAYKMQLKSYKTKLKKSEPDWEKQF
jgi:Domain of unknown function (DUF4157)